MLDGIELKGRCCVVALGIDTTSRLPNSVETERPGAALNAVSPLDSRQATV